ncbi:MAG: DUF4939 domain-containing protein, partial [Plesiomonas sp.]|uniref:DUF4939 domain-containing protein n=1 Tax=Plesiomonas sp. TaxID=2486279 RepID=UPI003F400F0E
MVEDLSTRLEQTLLLGATSQSLPSEPRVNNPPLYDGEPTLCRAFITQCEVVFSLQPRTYASEKSKVAFVVSLLTGRAREWGAAMWEAQGCYRHDFQDFKTEMIKVFDRSVFGTEASRRLASLRQGRRSVTDYSIEFRTLAATCSWNSEALTARFLEGLVSDIKDEIYSRESP